MSRDPKSSYRRNFLLYAAVLPAFAARGLPARAEVFGQVPRKLPDGQSIYSLRGEASVNERAASSDSRIEAGDTISTGAKSELIFAVGQDAFLLRENSRLAMRGDSIAVSALRLVTGALLSVFGPGEHLVMTPHAVIGIRGTGLYAESQPERSYVCACYGTVEISAAGSSEVELITSKHHDAPRFIEADGTARIGPAPVMNHTDEELTLLEALVGRVPPFAAVDDTYGGPRRY